MNDKTTIGQAVLPEASEPPAGDIRLTALDTQTAMREWGHKLDRFLETVDRSVLIGRELVEQKALNLDLQRQIHRLEDELRLLRLGGGAGGERLDTNGELRAIDPPSGDAQRRRRRGKSLMQRLLSGIRR